MQIRDMIVQADRVACVKEALAFRDAGANLIGVALDHDSRFQDERFVSFEVAKTIRDVIAPARLVGLVPSLHGDDSVAQSRDRIERVLALKPGFIQFFRSSVPDELVPMVLAGGVPVIIDGAEMNDDDHLFVEPNDPVSFFRFWASMGAELLPVLLHTEISGMAHPWQFLTGEALEWPDECLQIQDVAAATREFSLLLDLAGVRPDEIGPYVQAFPDARGFFATLGPDEVESAPSTKPEPLLASLRSLQALRLGSEPERANGALT